ncbi:MAG: hypothetical protein DHS20C17_28920 [Cyclobacteriaceae bacterium]|nr:MAG: hypothetical protein DHS20C17_28920 [Cyclobacteriaceae bacterium]
MFMNSEFERILGHQQPIHCNPLLLDGIPLDYQTFNLESKGQLTVVNGDPEMASSEKIPFYLQLVRNGSELPIAELPFLNQGTYQLEVSKVLVHARYGDQLVITPTYHRHWKAGRTIELKETGC